MALHGCLQGGGVDGSAFARLSGYNEWAESNGIVVLYPQIEATTMPLNPYGCWDWWGYDGDAYDTRDGRQVRALVAMIARVGGAGDAQP